MTRHRGCVGAGCPHCAAYDAGRLTDGQWSGIGGTPAARPAPGGCRHRGGTLRLEQCGTCPNGTKARVEACAIHGECTRFTKPVPGVRACAGCPDREDAPVLDPDLYVTRAMLARDAASLAPRVPPTVDAVVGVARSGLLVAPDIATALHLPLFAASRDAGVTRVGGGGRMQGRGPAPRHVLLIDDTVSTGREMGLCTPLVRAAFPGAALTRGCVYCSPAQAGSLDLFAAYLGGMHYLEWNWPNSHAADAALDFDGVLCPDFAPAQCASESSYLAAMAAMPPLHLPRRSPVPLVVTARPESSRAATEAWLARWGVRVRRLVMWPGAAHPPGSEVAPWKARHYAASGLKLFVESDPEQSRTINALSGRAVLCPALGRVLGARADAVRHSAPAPA